MKRITQVELRNFQSHEHSIVKFEEGYNAIVGQSDQGKTAILRAIELVLYNRPTGKDYIRRGAATCSVSLTFSDGTVITRRRSNVINAYDITYPDGRELHLENFGVNTPAEVLMAHGMRQAGLGTSKESLNISHQLDGPFLLQDSPGVRAVAIGRVANTDVVDRSIKTTMSDVRSTKQKAREAEANLLDINKQILEYNYLTELEATIKQIENIIEEIAAESVKVDKVKDILVRLKANETQKAKQESVVATHEVFIYLCEALEQLLNDFREHKDVSTLVRKIKAEEERLGAARAILDKYVSIDNVFPLIEQLEEKVLNYKLISNKINALQRELSNAEKSKDVIEQHKDVSDALDIIERGQLTLVKYNSIQAIQQKVDFQKSRLRKGTELIAELQSSLSQIISQYQKAIQEIGKCPICFTEVDEETLGSISKNLF